MIAAATCRRNMHVFDVRRSLPDKLHHRGLTGNSPQQQMLHGGWNNRVVVGLAPAGDCRDLNDMPGCLGAIGTGIFSKRALGLPHMGQNPPLQNDLALHRHLNVYRLTAGQLHWLSQQGSADLKLINAKLRGGLGGQQ